MEGNHRELRPLQDTKISLPLCCVGLARLRQVLCSSPEHLGGKTRGIRSRSRMWKPIPIKHLVAWLTFHADGLPFSGRGCRSQPCPRSRGVRNPCCKAKDCPGPLGTGGRMGILYPGVCQDQGSSQDRVFMTEVTHVPFMLRGFPVYFYDTRDQMISIFKRCCY